MTEVTVQGIGGGYIEEARIVEVLVAAGATVEEGELLMQIETSKAVVDIVSPASGRVGAVLVAVGDDVKEGDVVASIE